MAVLEVNNVTKVYSKNKKNKGREITALDNVSLEVNSGEIVGLIGPNGAGKSTLIKCITGLATQTAGTIKIDGFDTVTQHVQSIKKVGAIIEFPDMYVEWSGMENLTYLGKISLFDEKPDREALRERAESLLKMVNLYERRNDKVKKYSLGMKQRVGIAQALMSKPELLILDEPTNGLDPEGIKEIRDILVHLAHDLNMAVIISSHNLSELQLTCDRFLIIKNGKLIASLGKDDLVDSENVISISVDDVVKASDIIEAEYSLKTVQVGNGRLELKTEIPSGDIAKTLILNGVTVNGISVKERTLEEIFLSVTEKKQETAVAAETVPETTETVESNDNGNKTEE